MRTKLLSVAEVEELLRCGDFRQQSEEPLLCTIVELVLLADLAKKSRTRIDWHGFLGGLERVKNHLPIASLDVACLTESLFERLDDYSVAGLWSQLEGSEPGPDVTLRRLILRPSSSNWWEPELLNEISAW